MERASGTKGDSRSGNRHRAWPGARARIGGSAGSPAPAVAIARVGPVWLPPGKRSGKARGDRGRLVDVPTPCDGVGHIHGFSSSD